MKILRLVLCFCLLAVGSGQLAAAINVTFTHTVFAQDGRPYVEINMHLTGQSLTPVAVTDSTLRVSAEVLLVFKQGENIVQYDKFRINGPVGATPVDMIDVKRYALDPGAYQLEIEMSDAADSTNAGTYRTELVVDLGEGPIRQSDILLLSDIRPAESTDHPLFRNGLIMEPVPYPFYGRQSEKLYFYTEIYSDEKGHPLTARYRIDQVLNQQTITVLSEEAQRRTSPRTTLLVPVDISKLGSGNYELVVELWHEDAVVQTRRKRWQRSNPSVDAAVAEASFDAAQQDLFTDKLPADSLRYSLKAITVHVPQNEQDALNQLIKKQDSVAQARYLYVFWSRQNPIDPAYAYQSYMEVVRAIDNMFRSGFRHGFETDRGYVYLKYGQPSDIVNDLNDPSAPPYEIWSYNQLPETGQNNVRFIFYNPSLAADDFLLLHSDVIGERQNPNWQAELYRDAPAGDLPDNSIDGDGVRDNVGRRVNKLIRDY